MKKDLEKDEYFWTQLTKTDRLDRSPTEVPQEGWLQASREILQISQKDLAARLGISQQALAKLEKNEITGNICLKRLKTVAAEMDCEVVYWIRPKNKKTFAQRLWQQILPTALQEYKKRIRDSNVRKPMVLAKIAGDLFHHPQFRHKMTWNRKLNLQDRL